MKIEVIPSILVRTSDKLRSQLKKISKYFEKVQIDIADGKFVGNKTIQAASFKGIKPKIKLEVHLMVKNPEKYINDWKKVGAKSLIFHYEACRNEKKVNEVIGKIKKNKMKIGIALNPRTSAKKIKPFLKKVDTVLLMTVNPGWQGQKFLMSQLKKIRQIRKWNKKIDIEVDGGLKPGTACLAAKAGANKLVAGSFVVRHKSVRKALDELKKDVRCLK